MFNIPRQFTQGDRVTWLEKIDGYNPTTDTLNLYVRGLNGLINAVGIPDGEEWLFDLTEAITGSLSPGNYKAQYTISSPTSGKKSFALINLVVLPNLENLTELDPRDEDEKELDLIAEAISKLSSGAVSEYEIGMRKVKYQDLKELVNRQSSLRLRIARKKNPSLFGKNIGASFKN
jgi:hypothetical protein